jgi:hypothetical protein
LATEAAGQQTAVFYIPKIWWQQENLISQQLCICAQHLATEAIGPPAAVFYTTSVNRDFWVSFSCRQVLNFQAECSGKSNFLMAVIIENFSLFCN